MAKRKHKVWLSSCIFDRTVDTEWAYESCKDNKERGNLLSLAEYSQIVKIQEQIYGLIHRHKDIELVGFYQSSGARFYTILRLKKEDEKFLEELDIAPYSFIYPELLFTRLWNRPNVPYEEINFCERLEVLVNEIKLSHKQER